MALVEQAGPTSQVLWVLWWNFAAKKRRGDEAKRLRGKVQIQPNGESVEGWERNRRWSVPHLRSQYRQHFRWAQAADQWKMSSQNLLSTHSIILSQEWSPTPLSGGGVTAPGASKKSRNTKENGLNNSNPCTQNNPPQYWNKKLGEPPGRERQRARRGQGRARPTRLPPARRSIFLNEALMRKKPQNVANHLHWFLLTKGSRRLKRHVAQWGGSRSKVGRVPPLHSTGM